METLFNFLHNLFSFAVILTIIVFVHEYGHYKAAKFVGVRVKAFSIGMGKEIFGWFNKEGTRFKICMLPIGGYVSLFGHNEFLSNSKYNPNTLSQVEKGYAFDFRSIPERIFVVSSGPISNFLLGFILIFLVHTIYGYTYFPAKIGDVIDKYPAKAAGLKAGDVVLEVNGHKVDSFSDIQNHVFMTIEGHEVTLKILRDAKEKIITLKPKYDEVTDIAGYKVRVPKLGITNADATIKHLSIKENISKNVSEIASMISSAYKGVLQIILGERSPKEIGGVIKIAEYSGKSTSGGVQKFLLFIVALSVNLGFVNLLPIPGLDGGYIALYLIEAILGKNIAEMITAYALKVGVAIIIGLFIFTTYNDILGLITKLL